MPADLGILFQELFDRFFISIQLAAALYRFAAQDGVMAMVSTGPMFTQNFSHGIAADGKMFGQCPDRPPLPAMHNHQVLFKICPVLNHLHHFATFLFVVIPA